MSTLGLVVKGSCGRNLKKRDYFSKDVYNYQYSIIFISYAKTQKHLEDR